MREMTATLAGEDVELAATFKSSMEIAKKVADPLFISSEAGLETYFVSAGIPYQPKWRPTIENVPLILHIGQKAAGGSRTIEDMQDLVFRAGFIEARDQAFAYIAMMTTTKSAEVTEDSEASDEGK